jgi:gamma-glutamyltranspeptidase/glutathione hydrolase
MESDDRGLGIEAQPGMRLPDLLRDAQAPVAGPVYGARFAVAAEHPQTALVAMDVLRHGGNAADAAIAASAVNIVVKPYATHLGGDAFALIWHRDTGAVECLNAGGLAPQRATLEEFSSGLPAGGPRASTVPGLVDAWSELHKRHASLPLAGLLQPAIELAEHGFPASNFLAAQTAALERATAGRPEAAIRTMFLAEGHRRYRRGETVRQPEVARSLAEIASSGRQGFYGGATGAAIGRAMRDSGGLIDEADLEQPLALWEQPLSIAYRGCTVYEQALPSRGIALLMALNTSEHFPLADWPLTGPDAVHVLAEAIPLAYADIEEYCGDPRAVDVPIERLLSKEHAGRRAAQIDLQRRRSLAPAPAGGNTTAYAVADESTVICFIQSVYSVWGSGFVIPGTGILMNDRMRNFSTNPARPNCLAPGKRTLHTLNNYLVVRDGELLIGGATPGAFFQVQCNLQSITAAVERGLDISLAINSPRWGYTEAGRLALESRFPEETIHELAARGHAVQPVGLWGTPLSRSQVLATLPGGGWAAASDMRSEGLALAL